MGSLVEIRYTYNLSEALCIKSFLDAHGFYSLIQNEHHITMSSHMLSAALGGFRILTISDEVAEVRQLLAEADASEQLLDENFDESQISSSLW